MARRIVRTLALGLGILPAWFGSACGGGGGGECSPPCPTGETCYLGVCVPDTDGGDGEVRTDVDGRDDGRAEDVGCEVGAPELCNGFDDDCDRAVDEGFPCAAGTVLACTTACGTPGTGECDGSCNPPAATACRGPVETCNGFDDDCDTVCDNGFGCCADQVVPCTTGCGSTGSTVCSASCTPGTCIIPAEACNGIDDDCDTTCDNGFGCCAGTVLPCVTSCRTEGTRVCGATCSYPASCAPPAETCNGIDDDCDTTCDDGFGCCANARIPCATSCGSTGNRICSASCTPGTECALPAETCNGIDDDCDTTCDEGFTCCAGTGASCTTTCGSTGTTTCTAACTLSGTCVPPAEVCGNGLDDDCDSETDEGCIDNDTCATPAPLAPGAPASGDTSTATDNSHASCHDTGAPDVYYELTLDEMSDVFLHTVPSGFDSVLYASATCGGADLGCNDDIYRAYVRASDLVLRGLEPGTYYVTVDGYSTTGAGVYSLTMYETPAGTNGDDCGTPILIARPSTGTSAAVSGDTCTMSGQTEGSCGGTGEEAVYFFAVRERRTVTFSTCNAATTSNTVLYVRGVCDDDATELGCNDNAADTTACATNPSASRLTVALDPGLYFLYVDAALEFPWLCGAFRVDVTGLF